jgi:hypothetical protein
MVPRDIGLLLNAGRTYTGDANDYEAYASHLMTKHALVEEEVASDSGQCCEE